MTPLKQLFMHNPESKSYGDCYRTCIASILDCTTPEDVPHIQDGEEFSDFNARILEFLNNYDLTIIKIVFCTDEVDTILEWSKSNCPNTLFIMTAKSPRFSNIGHCVIGYNGKLIHDPHPDNTFVEDWIDDEYGISLEWIVPINKVN